MNKVIMHINYAEADFFSIGNKTIDDICRMATDIGFDGIEFRGKQPKELESISFYEYVSQIAESKKKYGLSEILFGIGLGKCTNENKEERAKNIAEAIEKIRVVSELCGTTVCNTYASDIKSRIHTAPLNEYEFHGSAIATEEKWKVTVDAYREIAYHAEKLNMKIAFETHMFHLHDTPEASMKLVNQIGSPAVGINMDFGNTVYFKEHPSVEETIDIYGDKLFYLHLKNSSAIPGSSLRMASSLADGEINHRSYFAKLKEVGFTGPIGIEAPRIGDRRYFAEQDFAYYKSVVKSI